MDVDIGKWVAVRMLVKEEDISLHRGTPGVVCRSVDMYVFSCQSRIIQSVVATVSFHI